ncbi:Phage tape measure protein [uncultured Mediterranean phage uvMED]|nr:Phage tape measure protein [uncultured Mediterranean phage uvMED]
MAAEYGININVRTKAVDLKVLEKSLKKVQKEVQTLQNSLQSLRNAGKKSTDPQVIKARKDLAAATKKADEAQQKYLKGILNFDGANRKSITSLRAFSAEMKTAASQVGITNDKFTLFNQVFTKTNFAANISSLKRFNETAKITASTFSAMGSKNVPGVIGFSNANLGTLLEFQPANTIGAIERYIGTLGGVRKQLDLSEKDYKEVNARIAEMNKLLKESAKLGMPAEINRGDRRRTRRLRIEERDRLAGSLGGRIKGFRRNRTEGDRRIRGQVGSSALIGGAFPLLFGQGGAAALGGFAGGAGGGLLGGQFGFALSLVGTQLGALVDTTIGKVAELGQAFGKFSQDTTKIVETLGESNTIIGRNIELLEKARGKQAAFDEAVRQTTIILGEETTRNLKQFGDDTTEISSNIAKIGMQFLGVLADINERLGITRALAALIPGAEGRRLQDVIKNNGFSQLDFSPVGTRTGMQPEKIANFLSIFEQLEGDPGRQLQTARFFGVDNVQAVKADAKDLLELSNSMMSASLAMEILNKEEEKNIKLNQTKGFLNRQRIRNTELLNQKLKEFKELTGEDATEEQILAFKKIIEETTALADSLTVVNNEIEILDKKLIELNSAGTAVVTLSRTLGSSFQESFKGIVKGTMSVSDAFRNMFNRIADAFLDMAAQMLAAQLSRSFLSLFNFAPFGNDVQGFSGPVGFAANGGPVTGGKPYIVGERGPELFTPGVSGMITPNHELGSGGSTNIVVNVDASGSSVEGDEDQGRELGRLISVAVQSEIIQQQRPGGLLA